jgi:hypothetical protein
MSSTSRAVRTSPGPIPRPRRNGHGCVPWGSSHRRRRRPWARPRQRWALPVPVCRSEAERSPCLPFRVLSPGRLPFPVPAVSFRCSQVPYRLPVVPPHQVERPMCPHPTRSKGAIPSLDRPRTRSILGVFPADYALPTRRDGQIGRRGASRALSRNHTHPAARPRLPRWLMADLAVLFRNPRSFRRRDGVPFDRPTQALGASRAGMTSAALRRDPGSLTRRGTIPTLLITGSPKTGTGSASSRCLSPFCLAL